MSMYKDMIARYVMMKFIDGMDNSKKFFFSYCIVYFFRSKVITDKIDNIRLMFFFLYWCGIISLRQHEGEFPDGRSQSDLLSFGMEFSIGMWDRFPLTV
jgi:hypothetical protein